MGALHSVSTAQPHSSLIPQTRELQMATGREKKALGTLIALPVTGQTFQCLRGETLIRNPHPATWQAVGSSGAVSCTDQSSSRTSIRRSMDRHYCKKTNSIWVAPMDDAQCRTSKQLISDFLLASRSNHSFRYNRTPAQRKCSPGGGGGKRKRCTNK